MNEELEVEYPSNGHFFFEATDDLSKVCNAPKNGIGVYLVYELKNRKIELVYIGSSGKIKQNGTIKVRKGGIYDRLVNGNQFDKPRKQSWKEKLKSEGIDALDVYWFETFVNSHKDIPVTVEGNVIQRFYDEKGKLPKWNKEF